MKTELLIKNAFDPALAMLPQMDSVGARILMLAIANQESGCEYRKQINGPAKSYWQFEQGGGVRGVLTHPASKPHIRKVLATLDYDPDSTSAECYAAIEHNDILAAAFARLLIWTDSEPLPNGSSYAWGLYMRTWRPGRPHPANWSANYKKAEEIFR